MTNATQYKEGIGRRKTAVARVRIVKGKGAVTVNGKDIKKIMLPSFMETALSPLSKLHLRDDFDMSVKVMGGGVMAQAEAIRHGLARALVLFNKDLTANLRGYGFLTRDPRMVERKKYGKKKARRSPQWQKR